MLQFANSGDNTAPTLAVIGNRTIGAGVTLSITNSASDTDTPPQTLAFNMPVAPTNAVLDTNSGVVTWRPWVTQANTTNSFTVTVFDNGTPPKSAARSFTVTVTNLAKPLLSAAIPVNGRMVLQVDGATGPDYQIQASTNLVDWNAAYTTNAPMLPFTWTNSTTVQPVNFFRILVGPPLP